MTLFQPRKRFGQHFLRERGVIERILHALNLQADDIVVEIGPGRGALTRGLVGRVAELHVVELDRDLVEFLRREFSPSQLTVHSADALRFDFRPLSHDQRRLRIIGNLPYNISTPLLFHLLDQVEVVQDMLFMLQKEVVERMAAGPGGKDYGRLSVMIQWRAQVEKLFNVPPGAFTPPPRVDSSVVRLVPHATPPVTVTDPGRFALTVQAAFAHRRKTLRNTLKGLVDESGFARAGIDPVRRAETLTLAEFARLACQVTG
ncbi:MAG: 16S rRNA (adenine(1518)-N(6)/adenine(1519)-N(6))-dimethyltransferase RsmA [Pseudomonadota bacterium]